MDGERIIILSLVSVSFLLSISIVFPSGGSSVSAMEIVVEADMGVAEADALTVLRLAWDLEIDLSFGPR